MTATNKTTHRVPVPMRTGALIIAIMLTAAILPMAAEDSDANPPEVWVSFRNADGSLVRTYALWYNEPVPDPSDYLLQHTWRSLDKLTVWYPEMTWSVAGSYDYYMDPEPEPEPPAPTPPEPEPPQEDPKPDYGRWAIGITIGAAAAGIIALGIIALRRH